MKRVNKKRFIISTKRPDRYGLVAVCQRYVDEGADRINSDDPSCWTYLGAEEAAAAMREKLSQQILAEIERIEVQCVVEFDATS